MANMKIHQPPATAEAYGAVEAQEVIIIILREVLRIIVEVQAIAQSPVAAKGHIRLTTTTHHAIAGVATLGLNLPESAARHKILLSSHLDAAEQGSIGIIKVLNQL